MPNKILNIIRLQKACHDRLIFFVKPFMFSPLNDFSTPNKLCFLSFLHSAIYLIHKLRSINYYFIFMQISLSAFQLISDCGLHFLNVLIRTSYRHTKSWHTEYASHSALSQLFHRQLRPVSHTSTLCGPQFSFLIEAARAMKYYWVMSEFFLHGINKYYY